MTMFFTTERLCLFSRVFCDVELVPLEVLPDHSVKKDQELTHAGDDGDLLDFSGFKQAIAEGFDYRVPAHGGDGGHVQDIADVLSSALNDAFSLEASGIAVHGRDADQGGDLAVGGMSEFRHA